MGVRLLLADNTVPAANSFNNSSAETVFGSVVPLPANTEALSNAGRSYRIKAFGYLSSKASAPGTLTFKIKWGSTLLVATAAIALPVSLANAGFVLDAHLVVCVTGTSGKVSSQGFVTIDNAGAAVTAGMVNTGTVATGQIAVNTQTGVNLGISATFSLADTGNIATLTQMIVEELT